MARIKLSIVLILCLSTLVVIFQNTEAVETKLLFVSITMPRALLIGVAFLVGAISGLLLATKVGAKKSTE